MTKVLGGAPDSSFRQEINTAGGGGGNGNGNGNGNALSLEPVVADVRLLPADGSNRMIPKFYDVAGARLVSAVAYTVVSATLANICNPADIIALISLAIGTLMMFLLPAILSGGGLFSTKRCIFLLVCGFLNIIGAVIMLFTMIGVIHEKSDAAAKSTSDNNTLVSSSAQINDMLLGE